MIMHILHRDLESIQRRDSGLLARVGDGAPVGPREALRDDRDPGLHRSARYDPNGERPPAIAASGGALRRPDEQVEDPHLGDLVATPGQLSPDRVQPGSIAIEVTLVAADELDRALPEGPP